MMDVQGVTSSQQEYRAYLLVRDLEM